MNERIIFSSDTCLYIYSILCLVKWHCIHHLYILYQHPQKLVFFKIVCFMSLSPNQEFTCPRRFCTFSQPQKMCSMAVLWLGLSLLSSVSKQNMWRGILVGFDVVVVRQKTEYMVVLWLSLWLLSSVSKHNRWSYYGWVCCSCRLSVSTIIGVIVGGFVALLCQKTQYVVVLWLFLSLLSSVSKHNMWSQYGWICLVIVNE